jgi:hypothetical protein
MPGAVTAPTSHHHTNLGASTSTGVLCVVIGSASNLCPSYVVSPHTLEPMIGGFGTPAGSSAVPPEGGSTLDIALGSSAP